MTRYLVSVVIWGAVLVLWPHAGMAADAPNVSFSFTGQALLDACTSETSSRTPLTDTLRTYCSSYIAGFVGAAVTYAPRTVCPPSGTTIGEMQHALIQWLVGHERYWPVHQTEAMAAFLRDVYPCQEATPRQQGRTFPK